jgi:hypothetical protein
MMIDQYHLNIFEVVEKAQNFFCTICKKPGAATACWNPNHLQRYHTLCLRKQGWKKCKSRKCDLPSVDFNPISIPSNVYTLELAEEFRSKKINAGFVVTLLQEPEEQAVILWDNGVLENYSISSSNSDLWDYKMRRLSLTKSDFYPMMVHLKIGLRVFKIVESCQVNSRDIVIHQGSEGLSSGIDPNRVSKMVWTRFFARELRDLIHRTQALHKLVISMQQDLIHASSQPYPRVQ